MELTIKTTPNEEYQKALLTKPKGYPIKDLLTLGRKYEAITKGAIQLKQLNQAAADKTESVEAIRKTKMKKKCQYCDTRHRRRACPAYDDECSYCGMIGHWKVVCRHRKSDAASESDESDASVNNYRRTGDRQQPRPMMREEKRRQDTRRKEKKRQDTEKDLHAIEYDSDEYEVILD